MNFYLGSCISPDAILQWIQQRVYIKVCANLRKSTMETLIMIRQAFREERNSRTRKVKTHRDWKSKTGEKQSQEHTHYFLLHQGDWLFTKDSSWQAKQSILHSTVTFYGDCAKMCTDFAPNFGVKRAGSCIMTMHHLTISFHQGIFDQKIWPLSPTHPTLLCFLD
jgi:hypothetical protein